MDRNSKGHRGLQTPTLPELMMVHRNAGLRSMKPPLPQAPSPEEEEEEEEEEEFHGRVAPYKAQGKPERRRGTPTPDGNDSRTYSPEKKSPGKSKSERGTSGSAS